MLLYISDISLFWLFPIALISIALSYFLYSSSAKNSVYSKKVLWVLRCIRFSAFFLAGLILLNISLSKTEYREEKPIIITLIDNSSSLMNYKDSASLLRNINAINSKIKEVSGDKFTSLTYTVDSEARANYKVDFKGEVSNLSKGFDLIHSNFFNKNTGAIVFISDGNFNAGQNPIYSAEKIIQTPIFTIGVGDTIVKKDHLIKDVVVNKVAFYKNKFPVKIEVEAVKMNSVSSKLKIYKKGKLLIEKTLNYKGNNYDFKEVDVELDADEVGTHQYEVVLSEYDGERNLKNNKRTFFVEILESRSKVLIVSSIPHPDIAAFKNEVQKDDKIDVKFKLINDWDKQIADVDLLVWYEPGVGFDEKLIQNINLHKTSVLYMIGPNTEPSIIKKLNIGLDASLRYQLDENQVKLKEDFQLFTLSEELKGFIPNLPPLVSRFGKLDLSPANQVLFNQRIGGVTKNDPVLFFGKKLNMKYAVVYGEGWWKWRLADYQQHQSHLLFNELVQSITHYLIVQKEESSLVIDCPKRINKNDVLKIRAEFYNESYQLITDPTIKFSLKDSKGKEQKNSFLPNGNHYDLTLGRLIPGIYNWKATARHNNKNYTKSGSFLVEDVFIEDLTSHADFSVLRAVSDKSNGKFYELSKVKGLYEDLLKRDDITSVQYEDKSYKSFIEYILLLIIMFLLLGTEWFLRRWYGTY